MRIGDSRSFLTRLRKDRRGNSAFITATAMVPLMGVIGSGIDMGRIYAAQTRLQHACDSATLVGRKVMSGNFLSTANQTEAKTFFRNNFSDNKFGTTGSKIVLDTNAKGAVTGVATVKVPMTIMQMFGNTEADVRVTCQAELNLPNTDVMFVLDTTGSMSKINPGDSQDRMTVMRNAVKAFHTQVEAAKSGDTQIRYGFVPYSKTVNVGHLLKPEWIRDTWSYQSREPKGTSTNNYAGGDVTEKYEYLNYTYPGAPYPTPTKTSLPLEACSPPASTYNANYVVLSTSSVPWSGPPAGNQITTRYRATFSGMFYNLDQGPSKCDVYAFDFTGYVQEYDEVRTPIYTSASTSTTYKWRYDQRTFNVSSLTVGGSIATDTGSNHTTHNAVWTGCIEERGTSLFAIYDPLPATAYDLQIDLVPNTDPRTQWGPWLPSLIWARPDINNWDRSGYDASWDTQNYATYSGGALGNCPSPARKLSPINSTELDNYLASLIPSGATHHDIGLVWGARLLSPTGLFASENASAPNGSPISRHLIFMTDGETDTQLNDYDAYGVTIVDRRRVKDLFSIPTKATNDAEVEKRFAAMCKEVKRRNITVWTIAFGTAMTPLLSDCASPGKSFPANNAAELNAAFSKIASSIARLRLTD